MPARRAGEHADRVAGRARDRRRRRDGAARRPEVPPTAARRPSTLSVSTPRHAIERRGRRRTARSPDGVPASPRSGPTLGPHDRWESSWQHDATADGGARPVRSSSAGWPARSRDEPRAWAASDHVDAANGADRRVFALGVLTVIGNGQDDNDRDLAGRRRRRSSSTAARCRCSAARRRSPTRARSRCSVWAAATCSRSTRRTARCRRRR